MARGIWQGHVFSHPVFLVSVKEVQVEHDSMPLHVLAGVPEGERSTIAKILMAEPALLSYYGAWMQAKELQIWQEIMQMSTKKKLPPLDYGPMIEYMKENTNEFRRFLETAGVKQTLAAIGEEEFLANLSPEQREKLRRLLLQDTTPASKSKKR